jgi:hypothetical protein
MTQYIVLNGPPRSGRSTLARLLQQRLKDSVQAEIHAPLKHLFCSALAMKWDAMGTDRPRAVLNGRSAIDALRQLRQHLRGVYGPDVLGKWLEFRILGMQPIPKIVIVDDVLFSEDLDVFAERVLIRIIRGNENNFTPISNPDYNVINGSDLEYLSRRADQIVGGLQHAKT